MASPTDCEHLLRCATVPVGITLCPADVTAAAPPLPLFFNVPRGTLLCALWGPTVDAFQSYVADFGTVMSLWFEAPGDGPPVPVPWHLPVGAIVDKLTSMKPDNACFEPLLLIAHTTGLPKGAVNWPITKAKEVTILVQQRIKQSLMSAYGDLKPFYKAPTEHINATVRYALSLSVESLLKDRPGYDQASAAMDKLGASLCTSGSRPIKCPYVVHFGGKATFGAAPLSMPEFDEASRDSSPSMGSSTTLIASPKAPPTELHLGVVLATALPLEITQRSNLNACLTSAGTIDLKHSFASELFDCPVADVLVAGVPVPLNIPISWAMRFLSYADRALHITVRQLVTEGATTPC